MKFNLITEKSEKRKNRVTQKLDAGNVPYNVAMFNAMNNASESPSTNPTGPMGEGLELNVRPIVRKLRPFDKNIIFTCAADNTGIELSAYTKDKIDITPEIKLAAVSQIEDWALAIANELESKDELNKAKSIKDALNIEWVKDQSLDWQGALRPGSITFSVQF